VKSTPEEIFQTAMQSNEVWRSKCICRILEIDCWKRKSTVNIKILKCTQLKTMAWKRIVKWR